jgi:hypothetical protein
MKKLLIPISLMLMIVCLAGCQDDMPLSDSDHNVPTETSTSPATDAESKKTDTLPSEETVALFLPNCHKDPKTDLDIISDPGLYQGWNRYMNESYEFSLVFPSDWDLIEGQNYLCLKPQDTPTVTLIVGFKNDSEDISIMRTGVGAGDLVTEDTVTFFDQEIEKRILKYQERNKAILYNNATEIKVDSMLFTLSLDDFSLGDYELIDIPNDIETTADLIVGSFSLAR